MLKSCLCDYSDAYIIVSGNITIHGARADDAVKPTNELNKEAIFNICVPFTKYISEINNTQVDDVHEFHIVMSMNNLIEYSNNYSKTVGSLWRYYKDEPNDTLTNPESFKFKVKIKIKSSADGNTKDIKIVVPSKYLINF